MLSFLCCAFIAWAQRTETLESAGNQVITKEFYPNGVIKTVRRTQRDGRLVGTLFHNTTGTPTHADYFDEQKRVRRTLLYRPDGTAHTSQEFDEQHHLFMETTFDAKGEVSGNTFHFQRGQLIVRSPAAWQAISHKQDASRDSVGFQIPNPADEGTPDSANVLLVSYDLSHPTNAAAFAKNKRESEARAPKPSPSMKWSIHTFHDKQGETSYEIRDAYRTLGKFGVHVRLAFPQLAATTTAWRRTLETDFQKLLNISQEKTAK